MRVVRTLLFGILAAALVTALSGCLETEAKLSWRPDGSMDLALNLSGEALNSQTAQIVSRLRASGFYRIQLGNDSLRAVQPLKLAGWDRLSGWLPGRLGYRDPSGLVFSRSSWIVFEDFMLAGTLDVSRLVSLPPFTAALGLPFTFKVEAPWPARASNADAVEGKTYVWRKTLGKPFAVYLLYRRWRPERAAVLVVFMALSSLALWRRSRRRRPA